uniref:RNA helicase n=1 Tax=Stomoxys calcitrans TaxID=35570 RepID=A0A1I8NZG2_STOCA
MEHLELSDHSVTVTHFINPHLFWYRKIGGPDDKFHVLTLLEERLHELYKNKPPTEARCRPAVGDKVAVHYVVWNKFIRAEILQKAEFQKEEYIVWAMDYGFPLLTKKEYLRNLPDILTKSIGLIHCGGVSKIQPAVQDYDYVQSNLVMVKQNEWSQKGCEMLEKLLADASTVIFVEQFHLPEEHSWGELIIVNHKGNKFNAREYLKTAKHAMEVASKDFPEICSTLKTINIAPWLSNCRRTNMKINSIKHNMAEHAQQVNSAIIGECAKRKVEDWCERNARVQNSTLDTVEHSELSGAECSHDQSIDDITFDDSVSVIHQQMQSKRRSASKSQNQHEHSTKDLDDQINYIGKAGAMTRLKQQKYSLKHSLPPQANLKAFNMDFDTHGTGCNDDDDAKPISVSAPTIVSSASSCKSVSDRLQRLAEVRAQHARQIKKQQEQQQQHNYLGSLDFNSTTSSIVTTGGAGSSVALLRSQKLTELRKKYKNDEEKKSSAAVAAEDSKIVSPSSTHTFSSRTQHLIGIRQKYKLQQSNETHSTIHPYQVLDQSTTTCNDDLDKTHDSANASSVNNARGKHLSDMRRKLRAASSQEKTASEVSTTEDEIFNFHELSAALSDCKPSKQITKEGNPTNILESFDFKLKPKSSIHYESNEPIDMPSLLPKTPSKASDKESQADDYDGLTMIPAGFDVTRLRPYRDENNHWHRKKTTRNEFIPHDDITISSSEEILINNMHEQSSSSSDFFQIKAPVIKQKPKDLSKRFTKPSHLSAPGNQTFSQAQMGAKHSYREDSNATGCSDNQIISDVVGGSDHPYPEISTSTSQSTINSHPARRQMPSPSSQISKMDEILKRNKLEKISGNSSSSKSNCSFRADSGGNTTNSTASAFSDTIAKNFSGCQSPYSDNKNTKNMINYTTLMEVKRTENLPIVEGEITLQTKFIDHLVLAHSSIPLMPVENVNEASFLPEIHEEMHQMRANKVYRIQVYSWSHVLRGNSLFVVNPARTGKTWSYLPALCSLVCCRYERLKPSYGPVAIVMVASSRHVESVYSYCRRLMSGFKADAPSCVPSYGMRNFIDTKVQLLNGCGILVVTPSSLLRLLKDNNNNEPLFDSERLKHIVIDDMDIMLSRSHEDFETAARIVFKLSKKSKFNTLQPQLIVTSRDWDGVMIRLMRKSNQPLLLIGDFLEAAVYGRATLSVKLKSSVEKNDTILKFIEKQAQSLQGDLEHRRILIMCNGDDDVETVMQFISEYGYPCLAYNNRSTDSEKVTVDEWKKKVSSQILICTDARFPELQVQNVHNLIHYSMPTSWTQFTTRFSALAQTYDNFVCKYIEDTHTSTVNKPINSSSSLHVGTPAHSMILLDEDNSLQLPRLVDFMRKHNQYVHPDILAVSKRVLVAREEMRICKGALLCPQLLEFGECDESRCDKRHELTRFDVIGEKDDIPCEGEMRILILKVFSPTYFAARLLQHKPLNTTKWREVRRSAENLKFSVELDLHYRNEANLLLHWPPYVNDLCMYKYADNFRRALILEAPDLSDKNINIVQSNLRVNLKLVDDGTTVNSVKCNELFVCHDKFKEFPFQAIDIRLMNVVPFDNERTWDSKTTKQVQTWLMDDLKPHHVVQVGIKFALAQTVWVNNMVVMEKLSTLSTYRPHVNLKLSLIKKNFAMIYKGERKHVQDIAREYGLLKVVVSNQEEKSVETPSGDSTMEDYESCRNDNSTDLIKFSSSNGEDVTNSSMESARNETATEEAADGLDGEKGPVDAVEDWDAFVSDKPGKEEHEQVFVPLKNETPSKVESWSQLSLYELTKVEIGDEGENGNWENIFLQIIDKKHMAMFDDLVNMINNHVAKLKDNCNNEDKDSMKRVYEFKPLHNCIVKYDSMYLRAKVHGVFGNNVRDRLYRFFLCDYACFTNVKSHELYNDFLYETTEEIVNFIPYQAIHCTLGGIQWDRFAKRYQVTKEYLYACAVEQRSEEEKKSLGLNNLPIYSYKILLYECEKPNEFVAAEMFNRVLVEKGITTVDEATKHYLDYKLSFIHSSSVETSHSNDLKPNVHSSSGSSTSGSGVYTFEQFLESVQKSNELEQMEENLLNESTTDVIDEIKETAKSYGLLDDPQQEAKQQQQHQPNAKKLPVITREIDDDEEDHCTTDDSDNKKSSTSLTSSSASSSITTPMPVLKALYKRPITTWYETDCLIFISIYAPDITDYALEVTQKTIFFATHIEDDEFVVYLKLLGSVNPRHTSHEIKGLNVIIRLVKNVFITWPRLLEEATKYSWLKYNYNSFDSGELEYIMPQRRLQSLLENTPYIDENQIYDEIGSDDSEQDRYQTFNPIETNGDDFDPFA